MSPNDNLSLYTTDELEDFGDTPTTVVPFVCDECSNIGGYYSQSVGEIACPHCGGNAHPINHYLQVPVG